MAQHDYDIANGSGAVVRADINAVLDAIGSNNSGATAPSVTFPYMFWADTTAGIMKVRNAANTAWINFQNLDGTLNDGSVTTAKIVDNNVTYAKIAQGAGLSVLGVTGNAAANNADITAGTDGFVLRRSGTTLAFGTVATAGIANNAVDNTKIRQGAALSVIGVTGNATANVADIAAGTDGHVLRRSGTALAFGQIVAAGIANNAVGNAQFRQGGALSVVGVTGNATANVADIAAGTDGHVLRRSGTALAFGTVATAGITANAVTNAKLAQMANGTIKGRVTAGTGDPEDLTAANVKTILALTKSDVGLGNVDNTSDATYTASTKTFTNTTFDANGTGNVLSNVEAADFAATATALGVLARSANTTGAPAWLAATAAAGGVLRESGSTIGFGQIATAGITDANVTYAKIQNVGALSIVGRSANSSGVAADIAATATSGGVLRESGSVIGFGTVATAGIADDAITYAKLQNISATSRILGRITAGAGDAEELTAANVKTILALVKGDVGLGNVDNTSDATYTASTKTFTNTTFDANGTGNALSNVEVADLAGSAVITAAEGIGANNVDTALPTSAAVKTYVDAAVASGVADGDKGDITVSSGGTVYTVDANVVSDAKLRQSSGLSVIGRSTNTTGNVADITAATDGHVLRLSGTTLAFGTVATAGIADDAITYAKLQNVSATNRILGRITAGAGDAEELTAANVKTILALTSSDVGLGSVTNDAQLPLAGGTMTGLLTTNGQVKFPATQNPSADVNTLDDYEEGSWTPNLEFGGGTTGITYSLQSGSYTKIGNRVFFEGRLTITNKGSSTGVAKINGLPFTTGNYGATTISYYANLASISGVALGYVDAGATTIQLQNGNAATTATLSNSNFTNTSDILFFGNFRV